MLRLQKQTFLIWIYLTSERNALRRINFLFSIVCLCLFNSKNIEYVTV